MSQDQVLLLLFKIVLLADVIAVLAFVADYSRLTRGECWRNDIGRTLVWKDVLLACCLAPSVLSLFWKFNRLTSHVALWLDVVLFGLVAPAMLWRIAVFERIHRDKKTNGGT